MADKASVSTFELLITQGIEAAKEEFKKSIKPVAPNDPNIDIEVDSKKKLLEHARTMKAYYHFLAEDAPATTGLDVNILEKVKEVTTSTAKNFDDLDKAYATLAPSLAKNISLASEINSAFKNLNSFLKGLSADIQPEDPLLKTAIEKALAEVHDQEKKVLTDEQKTKEEEKLLKTLVLVNEKGEDILKVVEDAKNSVETAVIDLKEAGFLKPLIAMNFPLLKMNFQNFNTAYTNLGADISAKLAAYDKAKESALAEVLKAKSGSNPAAVEVSKLIKELLGKEQTQIVLPSKQSNEDKAAADAKKEVSDKTAELARKKAEFTSRSTLKQTLEAYLLAREETSNLNVAFKLSLDNLNLAFIDIVDKHSFKTLSEGLNKNVNTIIEAVIKLKDVSGTIAKMSQQLSSKDAISDVREYLNKSSKTLEGLVEPVKNLSAITLSNIVLLDQLDKSVSDLYEANYKDLKDLYEKSALSSEETTKAFEDKINVGLLNTLAKELGEIKTEIGGITKKLDELTQDFLKKQNEAEFKKSIAAAA